MRGSRSVGSKTPPLTPRGGRQSMGDWQFEEIWRPKPKKKFLKLPISSGLSVSMSLNPGIHSEVRFAQSGNTFRGSPLLSAAHVGFATGRDPPPWELGCTFVPP